MKKLFIWFCTFIGWVLFVWTFFCLLSAHVFLLLFYPWQFVLRKYPNSKLVTDMGNIMQEKIGDMVKFAFSLFGWW
jgi:hypothetical protein